MIENTTDYVSDYFAFTIDDVIQFRVPRTRILWVRKDFLFRLREHRLLVINCNIIDGMPS